MIMKQTDINYLVRNFFMTHGNTLIAIAVAAASVYLMFVNLDYAAFWHDEGVNAVIARLLANGHGFNGWDGRNLFFGLGSADGSHSFAIDNDFNIVAFPPWPAIPSALGILLFGDGEFAVRAPHALLGALSLGVLWLLLRLNFAERPRLRLLAFALFALSPIVILYVRQGRYYADAILFTLLCFYCYQRFWKGRKVGWLIGLSLLTVLNFLNHFAIGFATAGAIALWHIFYYWRDTSRRCWMQLAVAGGCAAILCGGYLLAVGIIGGGNALEYDADIYRSGWFERHATLLFYYMRDTIQFGWLPLWAALWWAYYAVLKKKKRTVALADDNKRVLSWALLGVLLIVISALVSVQPVHSHHVADMRYVVMALPFILFMTAVFVDWVWSRKAIWGAVLLVLVMTSNFAGYPFIRQGLLCNGGRVAENFILPALIGEIHRPYPSAIAELAAYLRDHAQDDETILVWPPADYAVLLYYLGDKLIFCCRLSAQASLPEDKIRALGVPLYKGDVSPRWYVAIGDARKFPHYPKVYTGETFAYPTHRPELEFRCFVPPAGGGKVNIYRYQGA